MAVANPDGHGVAKVAELNDILAKHLARARKIKPDGGVSPPLSKSDFNSIFSDLRILFPQAEGSSAKHPLQYAVIEAAARGLVDHVVATTTMSSPDFGQVWNLFDILSFLADAEECEPGLLYWLVEELLDSQTIADCESVLDFLEGRIARITARHFAKKQSVILRMCNELLRRLSRAEDTAFCGRVFIFLSQCLPPGDKSSVNLRGEYHIENVTTYEELPAEGDANKMDVDQSVPAETTASGDTAVNATNGTTAAGPMKPETAIDYDALYPVFWSLQSFFSQPKSLFDAAKFEQFKLSLETTIAAFQKIPREEKGDKPGRQVQHDETKRPPSRKRDRDEERGVTAFNPKYLTSRDLFELELSDLSFRRHFMMQALIIMDFVLSLSAQAKARMAALQAPDQKINASVLYSDHAIDEESITWANGMKDRITGCLRRDVDGPYFHRTVETILSRDKNWIQWKVESCPPIEMTPVDGETYAQAKESIQRATTNKRLRPTPMGSLNLDFLRDGASEDLQSTVNEDVGGGEDGFDDAGWRRLRDPTRYSKPDLMSFKARIAADDLEIEMPTNAQTKAEAIERKASKTWRALRLARKFKLAAFDDIDDPDDISSIFEDRKPDDPGGDQGGEARGGEDQGPPGELPSDARPIVLAGPSKTAPLLGLVKLLQERHPNVFEVVPRHTTAASVPDGADKAHYHLVTAKEFAPMRDGDQFIEYTQVGDVEFGTKSSAVEGVSAAGRVPLLLVGHDGAVFAKDMGLDARYVYASLVGVEALRPLVAALPGTREEDVEGRCKDALAELEDAARAALYNVGALGDNEEGLYSTLRAHIFGGEAEAAGLAAGPQSDSAA